MAATASISLVFSSNEPFMAKQILDKWYAAREELAALNEAARDARAWKSYTKALRAAVSEGVRYSAALPSADERALLLRDIRRLHDVLYVADRVRQDAIRNRTSFPSDLMGFA